MKTWLLVPLLCGVALAAQAPRRATTVAIVGDAFHVNGRADPGGPIVASAIGGGTLPTPAWSRGCSTISTLGRASRWAYPDTKTWDPAATPASSSRQCASGGRRALLAFTLNLQGGSPEGYSKGQPWHNSAFAPTSLGAPTTWPA